MRTYPLFNGETIKYSFVVDLDPTVHNKLETECRNEWKDLFKLDPALETSSPYVPYEAWIKTEEGKLHYWLAERLFAVVSSIPGYPPQSYTVWLEQEEYGRVWNSLQAQRRHVMGPRRKYAKGHQDLTAYRKFRSWWLTKHFAKHFNIPYAAPCPIDKIELGLPTENYLEMAKHFEEWSGYTIPPELMKFIEEDEEERLAKLAGRETESMKKRRLAVEAIFSDTISDDLPRLAA